MKNFTLLKSMILSVMVILAGSLSARQLELAEALQRLNGETAGARSLSGAQTAKLQLAYTDVAADGNKIFYIINQPSDGGMLFVSADDCAPALLGYTDSGSFSSYEDLPENMRWWLKQYETGISDAIANGRTIAKVSGTHAAVEPLLSTVWRQEEPFNNLCNDVEEGAMTGCVATAMAQIMNYHKWPVKGSGSHSYTYNNKTISSDFSQHTYDWSNMLDSYKYYGDQQVNQDAVALLMRDCGVSVDMQYSTSGSGAATPMVAQALYTYFGYDKSIKNNYRSFMTDTEWEDLLISELEAKRPVLYAGTDATAGGHAFVCDGYDGNGKFHFNWGWGGGADGLFTVSGTQALNPLSYSFTSYQMIATGIKKDEGGSAEPAAFGMPKGFTLNKTTVDRSGLVYYQSNDLEIIGTRNVNAKFGLKFYNAEHTYYVTLDASSGYYTMGAYYMPGNYFYPTTVTKNGTYNVRPVFKDNDVANDTWHEVLLTGSFTIPTLEVTGTEDALVLSDAVSVYSDPKLGLNKNEVILEDMRVDIPLEAGSAISGKILYAYIQTNDGYSTTCGYWYITPSLTSGEKKTLTLTSPYCYKTLTVGQTYKVHVVLYGLGALCPDEYNDITFTVVEKPTTVTANMNIQKSLGCATFCAPFEVTIPSGVKAYRTSMKSGDKWITLNEITGTIPAATPVVLYCENGYENNFTATPTTTATTATDGVLTGNIGSAKTEIPTGNYILQNNTQGTGWYEVKTSGLYVGVNRCYMTKPAGARQAFYAMQIGETTGINSISATAAKMSDGKYLVNGRIVVVKSGKAYNMNGTRMK